MALVQPACNLHQQSSACWLTPGATPDAGFHCRQFDHIEQDLEPFRRLVAEQGVEALQAAIERAGTVRLAHHSVGQCVTPHTPCAVHSSARRATVTNSGTYHAFWWNALRCWSL